MQTVQAASDYKIISRGTGYCLAGWRQVYIVEFRDTPSIESLDASVLGKREVAAGNPDGIVVLNILPGDRPLPSSEVRAYAEQKQGEDTAGVLGHATILTGDGFRAGTIRSMLTGLFLVSRSPFPRKVFSATPEAAAWLSTVVRAGRPWATSLVQVVSSVQALGAG